MRNWKKMNKRMAGIMLGITLSFMTSATAFAYVNESAEPTQTQETQAEPETATEVLPETKKEEAEKPETEEPQKEDAFSTPGNGEVKDDITNDSSKEFLTITTKNNNTFYIVIDRSTTSQNVHMLSQIDENDLQEFIEPSEKTPKVTQSPPVVLEEEHATEKVTKEETEKSETETKPTTNLGAMITILLLALGGVGAYYYFKIYKPKKEAEEDVEPEGLEDSDGLEFINEDDLEDREEDEES